MRGDAEARPERRGQRFGALIGDMGQTLEVGVLGAQAHQLRHVRRAGGPNACPLWFNAQARTPRRSSP